MAKSFIHSFSVEHPAKRIGKRKVVGGIVSTHGGISSCSAAAVVGGARLTPDKRAKTDFEVMGQNHLHEDDDEWNIMAMDLARTFKENALMLVGDGEEVRVMPRS
jgi:hypothetical protein